MYGHTPAREMGNKMSIWRILETFATKSQYFPIRSQFAFRILKGREFSAFRAGLSSRTLILVEWLIQPGYSLVPIAEDLVLTAAIVPNSGVYSGDSKGQIVESNNGYF